MFLQHQDRLDPPILGGATSATVAAVATVTLVFGLPGESNPGNADLFRFDLETAFFLGALLDLKVARAVALATLDTWFEWSAFSGVAARRASSAVAPTSIGRITVRIAGRLGGSWLLSQSE